MKLVQTLISNTTEPSKNGGDPFREHAEMLLYMALIGYIHYELSPEEHNFASLLMMLNEMNASEAEDSDMPESFPVLQYAKYKMAAGNINCRRLLNTPYFRGGNIKKSSTSFCT